MQGGMGMGSAPPQTASGATGGQKVYDASCKMCHGTGMGGAPRVGDKALWQGLREKGMDTLMGHAIDGYRGNRGYMPPRGGNASLTDQQVAAAVRYMVKESE
jgi:cytochrome c5